MGLICYKIKLFNYRTMDGEHMNENNFFKPTALYKEYMILDLIEKKKNITQREISMTVGIAVSMVNKYLDEYEKKGYIKRKYRSTKTVEYFVTKKGIERRKLLNIWYLKSAHGVYMSAKDNIIVFLNNIIEKGFKKILLYGAGEVAEIILQVMNDDNEIPLEVIALIDDDPLKINKAIVNVPVIDVLMINEYEHDGILISSYTHHKVINEKLIRDGYSENNILHFFE